jgi:hypothetical protein
LVSDEAVTRRCWILIDVDPTRTAHTNSTDRERASAHEVITRIKEYLTSEGWPDPLECDSGNGSHLLYSVDLPNDAATRTTLANLLKYLAMFFDTPEAHVDQEVFNASRITKLYGTMTRKGPPSEARPHRLSAITRLPEPLQIVTTAAFMTVAGYWREGAGETPTERLPPIEHNVDRSARIEMARSWLANQRPAIQGNKGDRHTHFICCSVAIGHDLSPEDTFEVLREWNEGCVPPWQSHDLREMIRGAFLYHKGARGSRLIPPRAKNPFRWSGLRRFSGLRRWSGLRRL